MPAREELQSIWDDVCDELRRDVPDYTFHVWFAPLELVAVQGRTLFVRAPDHIRTWVRDRYLRALREAAERGFTRGALLEIVDGQWEPAASDRDGPRGAAASGLNHRYTFDQFVIGEANRFAHAAALAVAELPGQAFNPLFIHGSPGLGKTHLLHAIGNYVRRYTPDLTVRYTTVESFTSQFVRAVKAQETPAFKERFRGVDVLLLDDVQFLVDKVKTEEELFHTFNELRESGRQLVMTSDRGLDELAGLEERLGERFASGLVVALEVPDLPVRRAILHKRALVDSVEASAALLDAIAARVTTSVRALEAGLIQVVAYASLRGERATPELACRLLPGCEEPLERGPCTVAEIIEVTAARFGVTPHDLVARDRRPHIARARKVAMYLTRELTAESLPAIGKAFGDRDHSTVLAAIKRVESDIASDEKLARAVESLGETLCEAR